MCLLNNYVALSRLIAVLFILLPLGSVELNRVSSVFSVLSNQLPTLDRIPQKANLQLTQLKILLEPVLDPGLSPFPCWACQVLLAQHLLRVPAPSFSTLCLHVHV